MLLPLLVACEIGMTLVAARHGWLGGKVGGWRWLWRKRAFVRSRRAVVQARRLASDREVSAFLTPVIDPSQLPLPAAMTYLNPLMSWYWRLVRGLL